MLPPPCLTIFRIWGSSNACPGFLQHHSRLPDANKLNSFSSKKITIAQSWSSQSKCFSPHCNRRSLCLCVRSGFFLHLKALRPSSLRRWHTVSVPTCGNCFCWRSVASHAVALASIFSPVWASDVVNLHGRPDLGLTFQNFLVLP